MALLGPSEDQMKAIRKEVNEDSNVKMEENKLLIKEWIKCQPHLPRDYDERIVPVFLRGCKHDLERTKRKLDTYFTLRTTMPEFFEQRDPRSKQIQTASQTLNAFPLPRLTPEGFRVTVHRFTEAPVNDFEPADIYKFLCMIGDIRLVEESAIAGDVFLFDVANMSVTHIAKLANPLLRKILHCTQEGYPQRLKEIHVINAPPYIDKIVNMFKMFMKEKMRSRFHIHSTYRSVYDYVPQSILPEEFGGDAKSIDLLQAQWRKKLESYSDWFTQQHSVKADISKRKASKSTSQDKNLFGTEGAFRKLEID
ncbi:hypothetical protein LSTR_LSTR011508 [Laodelphax striatellus]|uniref:CRAL-TRIO domain-containing protein n=1 Tax=Laodelphax striatellus TaxID=195883 RepID=A0A482WG96_LAOST|nr:hypothetical protein LSTR_LSTR011508 [Laodelphax striatellus]